MDSLLGFTEFFVVALFGLAWAILEWVGRRLDRKRIEDKNRSAKEHPASE